jgi:5-methylcytosine-specific restriction endonuclease McrA
MPDDILPPTSQIITRAEARDAGLTYYFTGTPCKRGHLSKRHILSGSCVACATERVKALSKDLAYVEKRRKRMRAYNKANPDKTRSYSSKWRARNPDHQVLYQEANQERHRARTAAWVRANPDKHAAHGRNRHAKKKAAEGSHTSEDIQRIYQAQYGKCACCKTKVGKKYHVDHIQPLAKGGSNAPRNLQILCGPCNIRKNDKDPIDYMQSLGFLL